MDVRYIIHSKQGKDVDTSSWRLEQMDAYQKMIIKSMDDSISAYGETCTRIHQLVALGGVTLAFLFQIIIIPQTMMTKFACVIALILITICTIINTCLLFKGVQIESFPEYHDTNICNAENIHQMQVAQCCRYLDVTEDHLEKNEFKRKYMKISSFLFVLGLLALVCFAIAFFIGW